MNRERRITTGNEAERTDKSKDSKTTYKVNNDFENYTLNAEGSGNSTVLDEYLGLVNKLKISRLIQIKVDKRLNKENDNILDVFKQLTEIIKTGLTRKDGP
ncbi:hypothetical protein, partial [Escherichia coli]|uniref:hypothetical protein n=1 Tax=Escherichia coli TaxID=562 RepID=UPI0029161354